MNLEQILDAVERKSLTVEDALKSLHGELEITPVVQPTAVKGGGADDVAPLKTALLHDLVAILADVLEMDRSDISPMVSVLDYGLDSVSATEYMVSLNRKAGINHPPTAFFECDTLDELADVLLRIYQKEWQVFYAKDIPAAQVPASTIVALAKVEREIPPIPDAEENQLPNHDNPYSKDPLLHHLENCWQSAKMAFKREMR